MMVFHFLPHLGLGHKHVRILHLVPRHLLAPGSSTFRHAVVLVRELCRGFPHLFAVTTRMVPTHTRAPGQWDRPAQTVLVADHASEEGTCVAILNGDEVHHFRLHLSTGVTVTLWLAKQPNARDVGG